RSLPANPAPVKRRKLWMPPPIIGARGRSRAASLGSRAEGGRFLDGNGPNAPCTVPIFATFQGNTPFNPFNSGEPPDTHGAVGPNNVISSSNFQLRVQNRSGTALVSITPIDNFWIAGGVAKA